LMSMTSRRKSSLVDIGALVPSLGGRRTARFQRDVPSCQPGPVLDLDGEHTETLLSHSATTAPGFVTSGDHTYALWRRVVAENGPPAPAMNSSLRAVFVGLRSAVCGLAQRTGSPATFAAIAKVAGVSRSWLYTQQDLVTAIRQLQNRQPSSQRTGSQPASIASIQQRLDIALAWIKQLRTERAVSDVLPVSRLPLGLSGWWCPLRVAMAERWNRTWGVLNGGIRSSSPVAVAKQ
jgi:hypothetical protein